MCHKSQSLDKQSSTPPCPACKLVQHCTHQRLACGNTQNHPKFTVVYYQNTPITTFNGCGQCKWAQWIRQHPSADTDPASSGWPGCCRPPLGNESSLIPLRDWPYVAKYWDLPVPKVLADALGASADSDSTTKSDSIPTALSDSMILSAPRLPITRTTHSGGVQEHSPKVEPSRQPQYSKPPPVTLGTIPAPVLSPNGRASPLSVRRMNIGINPRPASPTTASSPPKSSTGSSGASNSSNSPKITTRRPTGPTDRTGPVGGLPTKKNGSQDGNDSPKLLVKGVAGSTSSNGSGSSTKGDSKPSPRFHRLNDSAMNSAQNLTTGNHGTGHLVSTRDRSDTVKSKEGHVTNNSAPLIVKLSEKPAVKDADITREYAYQSIRRKGPSSPTAPSSYSYSTPSSYSATKPIASMTSTSPNLTMRQPPTSPIKQNGATSYFSPSISQRREDGEISRNNNSAVPLSPYAPLASTYDSKGFGLHQGASLTTQSLSASSSSKRIQPSLASVMANFQSTSLSDSRSQPPPHGTTIDPKPNGNAILQPYPYAPPNPMSRRTHERERDMASNHTDAYPRLPHHLPIGVVERRVGSGGSALLVPRPSNPSPPGSNVSSSTNSTGSSVSSDNSSYQEGTVVSDGFTDYLSDDSDLELQRQAEERAKRAEQEALIRAEEAEFRAARDHLLSLNFGDSPNRPPQTQPPARRTGTGVYYGR